MATMDEIDKLIDDLCFHVEAENWGDCAVPLGPVEGTRDTARAALLDRIRKVVEERDGLKKIVGLANETYWNVDEWMGQASTKQVMRDSLWRLGQALRSNGYKYNHHNLDWRGSILNELNAAGFYPSSTNPYETENDFVYDPEAPNAEPPRIFGNAKGQTLKEIVSDLAALREQTRWVPVEERLPEDGQVVLIWLAEIEMEEHATFTLNIFWDTAGQYSYLFPDDVSHWRPLPEPPEGE